MADYKVRVPKAADREPIRHTLTEEDDYQMPTIKLGKDETPRYTIPDPTEDDPDNVITKTTFSAVILAARKITFPPPADKPDDEPKECRNLWLVRSGTVKDGKTTGGSYMPERILASPTSKKEWQLLCLNLRDGKIAGIPKGTPFSNIIVTISAERVKGKKFTWNKMTFAGVRLLTEAEQGWIDELKEMVEGSIREFQSNADLEAAEDEAINGKRVVEDPRGTESLHTHASNKPGDEEDAAPASTRKTKDKTQPAPAAAPPAEPATPKATTPPPADDEEETPPVPPVTKQTTPPADDEGGETPPAARRRSVSMPDDEE